MKNILKPVLIYLPLDLIERVDQVSTVQFPDLQFVFPNC